MNLLINSPFGSISKTIAALREKKGKEKDTLLWIEEAIKFGKGFLANLYFERILVYQHLVMEEDSKPEGKKNLKRRKEALARMEAATLMSQKYVADNKLKEWESRAYRFFGRLYDYKGQFSKSVNAYKKSIALVKFDPEVVEKDYPRQFELKAFLSFALIMSGKTKEGYDLAKETFEKFNESKEGKNLKSKDYYTWAVWKSGIPIRTLKALESKKIVFNKKEILSWLNEVEKDVNPSRNVKIWGDFTIRKDEIKAVKRGLREVN